VSNASRDYNRSASEPAAADPRHARQLSELRSITAERGKLDDRERTAIDKARELGLTWAQIATALGMRHRQSAQQLRRRLRNDSAHARHTILQDPPPGREHLNRAEDPVRAAELAAGVAAWARSQLASPDPRKSRTGLQRDLDLATIAMQRCLDDMQNRAAIADERNRDKGGGERPASQHRLPTEWEGDAIDCASRLRSIADQAIALARMHAQAVSDHNTASRRARTAQTPISFSGAIARADIAGQTREIT
jgi:hypothetical protein